MAKRAAQGAGTIRKKTVNRKGKEYTYWEARITVGRDPGTGKQIQRSFSGKTQKEVREKMQAAAVAVNTGTYIAPQKMTVAEWLNIWLSEYTASLKPGSVAAYASNIKKHIIPALGAIKLADLHPHTVQTFINSLECISTSTVRMVYRTLHTALEKAVMLDYIPKNPSGKCVLPKTEKKEINPFSDEEAAEVLQLAKGTHIEHIVSIALFTGFRLSEILGLTWDCIDTKKGTITINKQLAALSRRQKGLFISPKSGKSRTVTAAPTVFQVLKQQRLAQLELSTRAVGTWDNPHNLVFTMDDGSPVDQWRVRDPFKKITTQAGIDGARFHDLRHTYAVNAIRAGDDIKTIQGNLGHSSAAFTLDKYGHFTERMKQDSADRMERFINGILNP